MKIKSLAERIDTISKVADAITHRYIPGWYYGAGGVDNTTPSDAEWDEWIEYIRATMYVD